MAFIPGPTSGSRKQNNMHICKHTEEGGANQIY